MLRRGGHTPPRSSEAGRPEGLPPVPVEGGGGISASWGDNGLEIRNTRPEPIWGVITGQATGTNRYAFTQANDGDPPEFGATLAEDFAASGTSDEAGACAYEVNGSTDVAVGTRVRLWPAGDLSFYVFSVGGGTSDSSAYLGSTLVRILNNTGSTIPIRSIVRTSTPVDESNVENYTTDPEEQQARPLFRVSSLDNQDEAHGWVVTIEEIANGEIGRAVIQGVAVVDLYMPTGFSAAGTNAGPRAEPITGDPTQLIATLWGSARVLWPNPLTQSGTQRAVVLLEGRVSAGQYHIYKTDCEEVEGFDEPVNVRYRKLVDAEKGAIGIWEFDSYQGCCGCDEAGSEGGPGSYGGSEEGTFTPSGGLPLTTTANDCEVLTFLVSGMDVSAQLSGFTLEATHPNVGELKIKLVSPAGTNRTLIDNIPFGEGTGTADGFHVRLADNAELLIQTQNPASGVIVGTYSPTQTLAAFEGEDPNGTWIVQICDESGGNTITAVGLCFGTESADPPFTTDLDLDVNDGAIPLDVEADGTFTGGTPDYVSIDWGDESPIEYMEEADLPASHTYTVEGLYIVTLTGYTACGASVSDYAVVAAGTTGGTVGGCAIGGVLVLAPSTTCDGGAINSERYVLVHDGAGTWVYDAGGPVPGGGVSLIELSDSGGSTIAHVEGNCANGDPYSADLTQDSITCSPLSIVLSDVAMTGSAGCASTCNAVAFSATVTEDE